MKLPKVYQYAAIAYLSIVSCTASALTSHSVINFSDLISGPKTGLNDGLGEGVIVTIWGQNLGSQQGTAQVLFKDSNGAEHEAAHIYYWKNADGTLPSGPADLYTSHKMQEIAFSIPSEAVDGAGTIFLRDQGTTTNALPFTIRSGDIRHVRPSGLDIESADGSFENPWLTVNHAFSKMSNPGGTLYIHNIDSGDSTTLRAIWWKNTAASSTLDAQFAISAYPGTRPTTTGQMGVDNYRVEGMVTSKIDVYASNYTSVDTNDQPSGNSIDSLNVSKGITTDRWGRIVGNRITDIPGGCVNAQQGAINGNAMYENNVEFCKIFGNEIYEYGCKGTSKFHHTTYLSIRDIYSPEDSKLFIKPWEFGWNYLHDNHTKNGIHNYDENNIGDSCGDLDGTVEIHDNVVINQAGSGIAIGGTCGWSNHWKVYNNLLMNTGLASSYDGVDPTTADSPETSGFTIRDSGLPVSVDYFFNTVVNWGGDDISNGTNAALSFEGSADVVGVVFENNLVVGSKDKPFEGDSTFTPGVDRLDNISEGSNTFIIDSEQTVSGIGQVSQTKLLAILDKAETVFPTFSDSDFTQAKLPNWNTNILPKNVTGITREIPERDLFGVVRSQQAPDNGAVENRRARPSPPVLISVQ